MKNNYSKNNYCKCGKLISNNTQKCKVCSHKGVKKPEHSKRMKEWLKNPKNNPGYIDGRTSTKHYCIECGVKITYTCFRCGSKKCKSCNMRANHNRDYWEQYFKSLIKENNYVRPLAIL